MSPLTLAVEYANRAEEGSAYVLHVLLSNGKIKTVQATSSAGVFVEETTLGLSCCCTFNPDHVVSVTIEWQ